MTLLGAAEVRELAQSLDLHPSRRLGQNFVIDQNTIRRIVSLAELGPEDVVLEVGPGLGSLTLGLLESQTPVVAVEIDKRLAERLPGTVAHHKPGSRLDVITADAMDLAELPQEPTVLVANLPYNVAFPVLLNCLATLESISKAVVMVQAEVADRLAAPPGSRLYGVPSVKLAWYGSANGVGRVPPSVFWPVPRVDSGLVRFDRGEPPCDVARRQVFDTIDRAFAQRRKMLRASLRDIFPGNASAALAAAGVDPQSRPESLTVADFCAIARSIR